MMRLISPGRAGLLAGLLLASICVPAAASAQETVSIDAHAQTTPFSHFWEEMFGSGHAILSLRAGYRDDLRSVKSVTGLRYVRAHGILDQEVGSYNEDEHGNPVYNWGYVDESYDGLLTNGVRPLVEISFMPTKLAFNPLDLHVFWYHPNVSPPKSWEAWDAYMTAFAQHLVHRYGIGEVSQWYFEVWNEPNIDFWGGIPRQASYFELYAHTARALKKVDSRLRVGGPATAAASWVPAFLDYVTKNHVPIDFISSHGYADDTVENLFHTDETIPEDDRVCRAIEKVQNQIRASALPSLPLFWTEWNVQGLDDSRDTIFVGPGVANTIRQCDGHVTMMSFWTFSDVFEEGGPIPIPFEGHFGLIAKGGIRKPSYYDFALLHHLGDARIPLASKDVIATRAADGTLRIAAWNIVDPGMQGVTRTLSLVFSGVPPDTPVSIERVDSEHGNVLPKYRAMGSPADPTPEQVRELNRETDPGAPLQTHLQGDALNFTLTPNALVLVELKSFSRSN
ncbi:MAG TPA: glycosyl hydrolase family 39 [Acidobacteriaceae bacterium]|jgi:xylan 1,4-beta-xylosidase|nr:glycosyl hydrolase family 39 [Acidobacteriaceae bacterium]